MDVNLNLYKTFYIVADSKSYSEASEKLHKTVPAISKNITELENVLEVILFDRKSKGVELTTVGEELYHYLDKAFTEISKGQKIIMKKSDLATGELIIGCPSHIASNYLMEYIDKVQTDFPNLKIQLLSGLNAKELLQALKEHKIDFIIDSTQIDELEPDIVREEIKVMQNIFISKEPLKITNIKDLENYKCILPFDYTSTSKNLKEIVKKNDISLNVSMQIDITEVRVNAVKNGKAIGYVMKDTVKQQLQNQELYEVELPIQLPVSKLNLIYLKNYLTKADKQFIRKYLNLKVS